nr:protein DETOXIFICATION 26-like [Aegilops tauschii subsp. strangulata]
MGMLGVHGEIVWILVAARLIYRVAAPGMSRDCGAYLPAVSPTATSPFLTFMSFQGWEMMIPMAFLAGTGVRVSNELGAGNGKGVRFATIVSTTTSFLIGLFFSLLALAFHDKITLVVSSSKAVIDAVDNLSVLLAISILLNGVQPVLSGVAVGSGWQALVAYINVGSYYIIGVPVGLLLGWLFNLGVLGIWAGMIGGTAVQTIILAYITMRCDWDEEVISLSGPRFYSQSVIITLTC